MSNHNVADFIQNLDQVKQKRQEFASYLYETARTLQQAEKEGEKCSGPLFLNREIEDLTIGADNLSHGIFRLMVLGDMKHGKSTLLNVLLGKNLLPSAVNPCTAILTIIRYGATEKVSVFLKDETIEELSFLEFSQKYTIDPNEAKRFEQNKEAAFPHVNYAVVEYPLELLQNGVEIVDSPGLNDTDDRNTLTLNYINNCHAILFVLNATKPCTLEERRYLENYLKDRGLTIFFLINRWDEVQKAAFDPDDPVEVRKVEDAQRRVFQSNLRHYCEVEGRDVYTDRVFETSALNALRALVQKRSMAGTGLPEFIRALENFFTQERALAEFRQVRTLQRNVYHRVREAIDRRIPLLGQDIEELRLRIRSVEPEFRKLQEIGERFKQEIQQKREESSQELADSAYNFFSGLDASFEQDFSPYLPSLNYFEFFGGGKRKEFEEGIKASFKKYINDKFAQWGLTAEKDLRRYCDQLAIAATEYGFAYQGVTDRIDANLTGKEIALRETGDATGKVTQAGWARFAAGATALILGDYAGVAGAAMGTYNWRMLLTNVVLVILTNVLLAFFFNVVLGPVGVIAMLCAGSLVQTDGLRKEFVKKLRDGMKEKLPEVAENVAKNVLKEVGKVFDKYGAEVSNRINEDIHGRKSELEKLMEQREKGEFQRESEVKRLTTVEKAVYEQLQLVEATYDKIVEHQA